MPVPSPAQIFLPPSGLIIFSFALLWPIGGASAQSAATVEITLTDYAFSPAALELKQGSPYQIHILNNGTKSHNFTAPEFFADAQIPAEDMAKLKNGSIELANGQSADIMLTPGRAGAYAFVCTHFMHKMMGMHGTIAVQ